MTLLDLITKLETQNVNVNVIDSETDKTVIEFKSQGIAGVESDLSARTVKKWTITNAMNIEVKLDAAQNNG